MTSTIDEISRKIALMRSETWRPVVVAFANAGYSALTKNWLSHMRRGGIGNVVICALDDDTVVLSQANGVAAVRVADTVALVDLWILRAQIFESLARQGVDFIHSDIDAVWLRDARPRLLETNAHLAFSQGTIWPRDIVRDWNFVLCCGLFLARATPDVAEFFRHVSLRIVEERDDQISINRALRDAGVIWDIYPVVAGRSRREWSGDKFSTFVDPLRGQAGALSLALMPHDEFPRLPESIGPRALVAHPLSPKNAKAKIDRLVELGLWRDGG
jgi:hypothetical protein